MFSIVVIAVAVGVFTMYVRHERQMRRRRAELAEGTSAASSDERDPR